MNSTWEELIGRSIFGGKEFFTVCCVSCLRAAPYSATPRPLSTPHRVVARLCVVEINLGVLTVAIHLLEVFLPLRGVGRSSMQYELLTMCDLVGGLCRANVVCVNPHIHSLSPHPICSRVLSALSFTSSPSPPCTCLIGAVSSTAVRVVRWGPSVQRWRQHNL